MSNGEGGAFLGEVVDLRFFGVPFSPSSCLTSEGDLRVRFGVALPEEDLAFDLLFGGWEVNTSLSASDPSSLEKLDPAAESDSSDAVEGEAALERFAAVRMFRFCVVPFVIVLEVTLVVLRVRRE